MVKQIDTLEEFQELLEDERLIVIDFYAQWCGPCKKFSPTLRKLAEKYKEAKFVKIDVDINEDVAGMLDITSMPTFMLFRKGKKLARVQGVDLEKLVKYIERYLSNSGEKRRENESKSASRARDAR